MGGLDWGEPHTNYSYEKIAVPMYVCMYVCMFVGCCLATKVFIGKLPATRGVWVIVG